MDAECFRLRRQSRRLEKRYRRSQTEEDHLEWVLHERKRDETYRQKEFSYWNLRLSVDASSSRKLWRTLGSLMGSDKSKHPPKSCITAQQLLDFLNAKVDAVRQSTGN